MTETETRIAAIHRWIAKRDIARIEPVVMQTQSGKFACMISFTTAIDGACNILHLGFAKRQATAIRIATANTIGFASR